jgi:hypothetical protein
MALLPLLKACAEMAKPLSLRSLFEIFYASYPKKLHRDEAFEEWVKLKPGRELLDRMLEGMDQQKVPARTLCSF